MDPSQGSKSDSSKTPTKASGILLYRDAWSSPGFLRSIPDSSYIVSPHIRFVREDDESPESRARKRTKFWRKSGEWKFSQETPDLSSTAISEESPMPTDDEGLVEHPPLSVDNIPSTDPESIEHPPPVSSDLTSTTTQTILPATNDSEAATEPPHAIFDASVRPSTPKDEILPTAPELELQTTSDAASTLEPQATPEARINSVFSQALATVNPTKDGNWPNDHSGGSLDTGETAMQQESSSHYDFGFDGTRSPKLHPIRNVNNESTRSDSSVPETEQNLQDMPIDQSEATAALAVLEHVVEHHTVSPEPIPNTDQFDDVSEKESEIATGNMSSPKEETKSVRPVFYYLTGPDSDDESLLESSSGGHSDTQDNSMDALPLSVPTPEADIEVLEDEPSSPIPTDVSIVAEEPPSPPQKEPSPDQEFSYHSSLANSDGQVTKEDQSPDTTLLDTASDPMDVDYVEDNILAVSTVDTVSSSLLHDTDRSLEASSIWQQGEIAEAAIATKDSPDHSPQDQTSVSNAAHEVTDPAALLEKRPSEDEISVAKRITSPKMETAIVPGEADIPVDSPPRLASPMQQTPVPELPPLTSPSKATEAKAVTLSASNAAKLRARKKKRSKKRKSTVPAIISPWFASRQQRGSTESDSGSENELERPVDDNVFGLLQVEDPEAAEVDKESTNATLQAHVHSLAKDGEDPGATTKEESEAAIETSGQDTATVPANGFRTSLSYYSPLSNLSEWVNRPPHPLDFLAVVTLATAPPSQAKAGAKDWSTIFRVTDPSTVGSSVRVQIFRPYKDALPEGAVGDVVLLRNFVVKSRKHQCYLLSADASAWLVWRTSGGETRQECKGPPVEVGPDEQAHVATLTQWWSEAGDLGKN